VNTNTIEGVFSIFKRGMTGIYQHCDASIFTAIWPSSISAITIASRFRSTTSSGLTTSWMALAASG
jgi:hypothetical protein